MRLGFLPDRQAITALQEWNGQWNPLAGRASCIAFAAMRSTKSAIGSLLHEPQEFCAACRHNRTISDLTVAENLMHWRKIESAKHRLFYTLLRLKLPHTNAARIRRGLHSIFSRPRPTPRSQGQL